MAQIKYEVLADRISLVVKKGSVVIVDEKQYEVARPYLKEVREEPKAKQASADTIVPAEEKAHAEANKAVKNKRK